MVERVLFGPGGSTEAKQDIVVTALSAMLTELQQKLESGGVVALDAATLAALESTTASVSNFPADFPDGAVLAKVEQVRTLLATTLAIAGTVALDAGTLAALESVTAGVSNFPADFPDAAVLAKVEAVRALLAAPLAVTGPMTDAELRASAPAVKDDYQGGECLPEQSGAGAVLTFTFAAPVQLVHVEGDGADTDVARVDPFGGTPTATQGFRASDGVGIYLPVTCTVVRVWAPAGMVIACNGFRRA